MEYHTECIPIICLVYGDASHSFAFFRN